MKVKYLCLPLLALTTLSSCATKCSKHEYSPVRDETTGENYFVCGKCGETWDPNGVLNSEDSASKENPESFKPTYSILFIGNSFTFRNDLPKTFSDFVKAQGFTVHVDSVTYSSYYLDKFADPKDEQGAIVAEKLEKNKYDYVFLQEQSRAPIDNQKRFFNGVRTLVEKVRSKGAEPILYETWGFPASHSSTASYGGQDAMARKIAAAYEAIGEELGVTVSKAGMAFHTIFTNHKDINLYHSDHFHPSVYGTYLAMLTHYATIYHKTVKGAPYVENLYQTDAMPTPSATQLTALQDAAYEAAFSGKTIVTKEYKISSENIR